MPTTTPPQHALPNVFNGDLIIDSNVWMKTGAAYDHLFSSIKSALLNTSHHVLMSGTQLDEIRAIESRTGHKTSIQNAAKLALSRILKLQKDNILLLQPEKDRSQPRAYADPIIRRQVIEKAGAGGTIILLSCDQGLCSRTRVAAGKLKCGCVRIYDEGRIQKELLCFTQIARIPQME
jgi:hypothetical protein